MSNTPVPGTIVDGTAIDTLSVIAEQANSKYPPYSIQGTGALPVNIVNPVLPPAPVPGTWDNLLPPTPPPLVRTGIVGVQNLSVYMDKVLVPVSGDAVVAVGGIPNPRPLTGLTIYPTIIIGTKS